MTDKKRLNTVIGWVLGTAAVGFVLLLAGVASGALTEDPPAVSPYASGSSDAVSDQVEAAAITIQDFAFGDPITVTSGQEVIVTNRDGLAHTWTSTDAVFDSRSIAGGGGSFTFSFDDAGEYAFFCAIHPSMTGSITVEG